MQTEPNAIHIRLQDGTDFVVTPETPLEEYQSKLGPGRMKDLWKGMSSTDLDVVEDMTRRYVSKEDVQALVSLMIVPLDETPEQKKERESKILNMKTELLALQYYVLLSQRSHRGELIEIDKLK